MLNEKWTIPDNTKQKVGKETLSYEYINCLVLSLVFWLWFFGCAISVTWVF